jgi:hypothetical protein
MAKYYGKNAKIYLNQFDLSANSSNLAVNREAGTAETTGFGEADQTHVVGIKGFTVGISSFWEDTTTTGTQAVYTAALGSATTQVTSLYPSGTTIGMRGWGNSGALETSFNTTAPVAGVVTAEVNLQGSGDLEQLWCLGGSTSTNTGASAALTSYDLAASAASETLVGYLHVTAFSGSPTLDVIIQDSPDDSTFSDLITFTAASAVTSQRATAAASSSRYFRTKYTLGASTTSATFMVGFHRN